MTPEQQAIERLRKAIDDGRYYGMRNHFKPALADIIIVLDALAALRSERPEVHQRRRNEVTGRYYCVEDGEDWPCSSERPEVQAPACCDDRLHDATCACPNHEPSRLHPNGRLQAPEVRAGWFDSGVRPEDGRAIWIWAPGEERPRPHTTTGWATAPPDAGTGWRWCYAQAPVSVPDEPGVVERTQEEHQRMCEDRVRRGLCASCALPVDDRYDHTDGDGGYDCRFRTEWWPLPSPSPERSE